MDLISNDDLYLICESMTYPELIIFSRVNKRIYEVCFQVLQRKKRETYDKFMEPFNNPNLKDYQRDLIRGELEKYNPKNIIIVNIFLNIYDDKEKLKITYDRLRSMKLSTDRYFVPKSGNMLEIRPYEARIYGRRPS